jgi:hypothetical protein
VALPLLGGVPDEPDNAPPTVGPSDISNIAYPAIKVAGVCHFNLKGKGKQIAVSTPRTLKRTAAIGATQDPHKPPPLKKQCGQVAGSANYSAEDINMLLYLAKEFLPFGGKTWMKVADHFQDWASEHGRPLQAWKSLEGNLKQVCIVYPPRFHCPNLRFIACQD